MIRILIADDFALLREDICDTLNAQEDMEVVGTAESGAQAEARGADYLGVGAVFPTSSKDDARPVTKEVLRAITDAVRIPVVAIGGITEENTPALAETGIDGIAVISAIFGQEDIEDATRRLKKITKGAL